MINIFKGDSTIFANNNKFLTFNIETDLDLSGWKAMFKLGPITKLIEDISPKTFDVVLTYIETTQLFLGKLNGVLKLIDDRGNIKTVSNTLEFEVTDKVIDNKHDFIDLNIPKTTGVTINVEIGSGSSGGTTNYDKLNNKPSINNIELKGNKTLEELGVQASGNYALKSEIPSKTSELENDSNFINSSELEKKDYATNAKVQTVDDKITPINGEIENIKQELPNKLTVSNIIQGDNITLNKVGNDITINATTQATGITKYEELPDKPQINSVELVGNKTLEELGIQPKGNYLTSIPAEYVTETQLNSKNYATNTQLEALNTKLTSTDDEVNLLTGEISDINLALPKKLEASNIIQGDNITLLKDGNNITISSTGGGGTAGALTRADKGEITTWFTPSDKHVTLTMGASGTRHTAQADGYVVFSCRLTNDTSFQISNTTKSYIGYGWHNMGANKMNIATIPVAKGDIYTVLYKSGQTPTLEFIYAKGAEE